MSIPQNGQTHSNNLSAASRQIVWVRLIILWGWHLKGYASGATIVLLIPVFFDGTLFLSFSVKLKIRNLYKMFHALKIKEILEVSIT